jgi:hypothetical protein
MTMHYCRTLLPRPPRAYSPSHSRVSCCPRYCIHIASRHVNFTRIAVTGAVRPRRGRVERGLVTSEARLSCIFSLSPTSGGAQGRLPS